MIIKFFQDLIGITDMNQGILEMKERRMRDIETIRCLNNRINTLESRVNAVSNLLHIGVDLHYQGCNEDWAVVCIEGKQTMVQFFRLGKGKVSLREITQYFNQFTQVIYDAPPGMRDLILRERQLICGDKRL